VVAISSFGRSSEIMMVQADRLMDVLMGVRLIDCDCASVDNDNG